MDAASGRVYYEKDADIPLAPASMTKVMTTYLIYEAINNGTLTKDTLITADADDQKASADSEATNVYLEAGKAYSVDELIGAILVPSACAASAMVGKYISGSESAFADLMTKTASDLGLSAYYEDASGLSDNNRITARSMAKLVNIFITQYPDVLNYTSQSYIFFDGKKYKSTNSMLSGGSMAYFGVDGFKTGTTNLAGCCFSASAINDNIRLISVTMHSDYGGARFKDTKQLLDQGFTEAEMRYNNLYGTNLKVFVNGCEMPAFCYTGYSDQLVIIAEDLSHYGFNVDWNSETMLLSISHDPEKKLQPIDTEPYKTYTPETPIIPINYSMPAAVQIRYKNEDHTIKNIHPLSGYIAVSADELGEFAQSVYWDENSSSLYIEF